MLSGGDDILPSAWEDRFMNRGLMPADARWRTPKDFTLLDHIAIPATRTKSSDPLPDNEADGDLYDFNDPRLADPLVRAVGHEYYRPDAPYFQPLYRTWRAEAICASGFSGQDNAWPQYNQMQYLFNYGRVETGTVTDAGGNKNTVSATRFFKYWNGPGQLHSITRARNLGKSFDVENSVCCADGPDDSGHPLPQVVSLGFNLLFPSPFPGVPSMFKRFSRDIQVPSGSQYQGARP
jgi:hypothetical protein